MKQTSNKGFSLFEIMIVLVAIGLATGSVVAGKSLLRSAALKSLHSEMETIRLAHNQFRMEYNALAGDFADATKFWGEANSNFNTCKTMNKSAGIATCNGDGNGEIKNNHEMYFQWQHLANAGLIEGKYTGAVGVAGSYDHDVGINCPASKFRPGTGYGLRIANNYGVGGYATDNSWYDGTYGHILMFGKEGVGEDNLPKWPALTSEEMQKFDSKFDDGMPAKGNIVVRTGTGNSGDFANCTQKSASDTGITIRTDLDSIYRISASADTPTCQIIFRNIMEK